ncbi:ABC-2 type transport system permease protein [Ureibacillus xyleni]|uniref:ABC-2 type transport system permease protein n=1 Tax=Ureibacillus xyleni TaxID=614648 RepID=A0A285TGC3_9BACL|nr:ABC transporter permease [Ureibacillus xyleni]SOC21112.1 ABC-2 type transport system permease protein [Ureibacillus xyleni]
MINILKTKLILLKREPLSFIVITIIICLFAYILGLGQQAKLPIAVYSNLDKNLTETMLQELKKMPDVEYQLYDEEEALKLVEEGDVELAVHLQASSFELISSPNFLNAPLFQNEISTIYREVMQNETIVTAYPVEQQKNIQSILNEVESNASFNVEYTNFSNDGDFIYDSKLHSLFGFTLFMVIYTIANGVNHLVMERRNHIWSRLTVSSIGKTQIYIANLAYSFLLGYLQVVLVLSIFHFGVGVDFYGGFFKTLIAIIPYLFCIVALTIFVASIAETPGKFNAFIVVLAVPFAMLGGAYWPIEIVTSKVILTLSYISPITYGMQILNGVTIHGATINELFQPLGMLLLMAVILMGIGINVLEKKGHS